MGMDAATRIDGRYRYRVDAPLAPSLADNLPDYVPDSWPKTSAELRRRLEPALLLASSPGQEESRFVPAHQRVVLLGPGR
jgi:hypothetical protein